MKIAQYKVYIPESKGSINKNSLKIANVLFLELANYGYELDANIFSRLIKLPAGKTQKFAEKILSEYTMGNLNPPLFKNWEDRTYFSFPERVVQILGYCFQFCGNDFDSESFMADMKAKVDFKKAKAIKLATNEEFQEYFTNLIGSNLTLDKKTSNKLVEIFDYFAGELEMLPRIKSAEIRIAALLVLTKQYTLLSAYKALKCNALDVLRYAAAKSEFQQFKLPADVKYSNLTWAERVAGFEYLNNRAEKNFEAICEDMGLNRTAWLRYFKHTHFFGQSNFINRFNSLYIAAYISLGSKYTNIKNDKMLESIDSLIKESVVEVTDGGNLAYRTFASRIQSAIEKKDWKVIKKLLINREDYLFRNITSISNGIKLSDSDDFVKFFANSITNVDIGILFSILTIDVNASYRIIDVKGKTVIETAQYPKFFKDIQGIIYNYIKNNYSLPGKIVVDKELQTKIVPFLSKNTNLDRGTKIKIDNNDPFVYFYVHWVQNSYRTDLDLSFITFDANWKYEAVAFYRQANGFVTLSGDMTNAEAPNGATEYGKISLNSIPAKTKYIAPVINVYSGDTFDKNKEVRAGFFSSKDPYFNLNQNSNNYLLTQNAQMNCPFILDVEKKEIITLDYNRAERVGFIAAEYADDLKKIITVTQTKNYFSIAKLAEMLSGDSDFVSLTVTNNAKNDNQISPEQLFTLFS